MMRIREIELHLLSCIAKHGYVDIEFVRRFIYKNYKKDTVRKKITALKNEHYIVETQMFIPAKYTVNHRQGYRVFALGKKGLATVKEHYPNAENNIKTINTSSPYRMFHQVQVASVDETLAIRYSKLKRKTPYQIIQVLNEKEAYNHVLQHQPDAIAIFKSKKTGRYACLFLEIERSYTTIERLKDKLMNYHQAIHTHYYDNVIGKKLVRHRVLFISQTTNDYEVLKEKLQSVLSEINVDVACVKYQDLIKKPLYAIYELPGKKLGKVKLFDTKPESKKKTKNRQKLT